ncbi:uncharacterized protein FIBRA_05569 [Fibroporia radiculosa]|uniref:Uncharacterized protein n=1 Tax=Fibroporia radiculosa TaxID=599839 RepID=J4IAS8_9APHY|nr:uncharacterized protein FIBRA_05569 [Fibroporia radiculosa]CCM03436.1 predicted protein [Fibroporia radiculosa]
MTGPNLGLDSSMGCFFIGVLFAIMFYGFTCAQVLYYVWRYPKDQMWLKTMVAVLWLLDTATTIFDVVFIWHYVVGGHADIFTLLSLPSAGAAEYGLAVRFYTSMRSSICDELTLRRQR